MPSIEFEVWCSCGNGLCTQTTEKRGGIEVEPCERCMERARDDGEDTGYTKGYAQCEKDNEI